LVAVPLRETVRYRDKLSTEPNFNLTMVTNLEQVQNTLSERVAGTSVLVIDNRLGDIHTLIKNLRLKYPHLLIIEIDEEADFSLPGQADDVSNTPFENDELIKKIKTLVEDRRLETLRADSLPSVRSVAKALMQAKGSLAKTRAAVDAIAEMGYDYVAFFNVTPTDPPSMSLVTQVGDEQITRMAPTKLSYDKTIVGWTAQTGQAKIFQKEDELNHPFVARGRFKEGLCVAVGNNIRFGVIMACHNDPERSISTESLLQVELIGAQLASALAREANT
ncbi:MAG: hypothetical protein CUN55_15930, partial [Phototrophicales bacterium]